MNQANAHFGVLPAGFRVGGVHCGIKQTRLDLGLILSEAPCSVAGVYTQNPVRAACVDRNATLTPHGTARAVIINSGNANALTGARGTQDNEHMAALVAETYGVSANEVLTASTGVIGRALNTEAIAGGVTKLRADSGTSPSHVESLARAILTTDTCTKAHSAKVVIDGTEVTVLGVAKGSGMIHPNMATTLGFVLTDAAVAPALLQRLLSELVVPTFNAITVDGDTSTNDTVLALASGASASVVEAPEDVEAFRAALSGVLTELAKAVARDGEGATKLMQVDVVGAPSANAAHAIARGCCRSSLFKCSVFAGQPEWGRLAAAAGQSALEAGAPVDLDALAIETQGIELFANGVAVQGLDTAELHRRLRDRDVHWRVVVGNGPASFTAWGCDLSYDYVRINADEAPQVEVRPDGRVRRNLTLAAYSPRLKHQLLVDGLSYVRKFAGTRALVWVHGHEPGRLDVVASLAQDLELCLDAGIRPVLVVPDASIADELEAHMTDTGHYVARPETAARDIAPWLDRGYLCVVVQPLPDPTEVVDLALRLGIQKLLALGDDHGLRDARGLVESITPEVLMQGLDRGRFETQSAEALALARLAAQRGVPALHLLSARVPHALVGELFTNQGIGTLITRQIGAD